MEHETEPAAPGVTVVTGASAGLGRALCAELLGQGAIVAGIARSQEPLTEIAAAHPGRFLPLPIDVADPGAVAEAFARIRADLGPVATLVNNAAVYPHRDILDETPESFDRTLQVNLGGMVACTAEALRDMVPRGTGRIVNVTTHAGEAPAPLAAAYSVSKGACRIYTRALLADLGDRFPDIVITEWIPGALNTAMGLPEGIDPQEAARWGVRLARMTDRGISGLTFERDRSVPPPMGLKRRLVNRFLGQRVRVIRLD